MLGAPLFDTGFWGFAIFTGLLGGGAAFMTGKAFAETWRSQIMLALSMLLLAAFTRFLNFALLENGVLLSFENYVITYITLLVIALVAFTVTRRKQFRTQYPWEQ